MSVRNSWELWKIWDLDPLFVCLLQPQKCSKNTECCPPSASPAMDSKQPCLSCEVKKTLDQFRATPRGLTSRCIACLDKLRASRHARAVSTLQETVKTLPTLEDFYFDLERAKEQEPHTHTIPFHSKEASDGNGMHTVRIASLRNDNDIDLQSNEGTSTFKGIAEGIGHQCEEILGYRWRCVLSWFVVIVLLSAE